MVYNKMVNFFKKNLSKNLPWIVAVVLFSTLPIISLAQGTSNFPARCDPSKSGKICNPIDADSLSGLLKTILEGALKIGMPLIALAVIYSGFLFVSARGNPEKLTKAKDALLWTLVGAAILLGSWAIAELISETVLSLT